MSAVARRVFNKHLTCVANPTNKKVTCNPA